MKDIHTHARKIRSDAAECLVLSNLVSEKGRHLFVRIAEHLNSLALEIETETAMSAPDEASPVAGVQVNFADQSPVSTDPKRVVHLWRRLAWSLPVVLIVIAAALLWALNPTEFLFSRLSPKPSAEPQASARDLAAFFSEERGERRALSDQLNAVTTRLDSIANRLDSIAKELDGLKALRAGIDAPSTTRGVGQQNPSPSTEATPAAADETVGRAETSSASSAPPAAAPTKDPVPSNDRPPSVDANDQVGTVSATRTEPDPRKPTIGPAGCRHFHSFDPASETYTTFDGRRRQCR